MPGYGSSVYQLSFPGDHDVPATGGCTNNLKQIGIALHHEIDADGIVADEAEASAPRATPWLMQKTAVGQPGPSEDSFEFVAVPEDDNELSCDGLELIMAAATVWGPEEDGAVKGIVHDNGPGPEPAGASEPKEDASITISEIEVV